MYRRVALDWAYAGVDGAGRSSYIVLSEVSRHSVVVLTDHTETEDPPGRDVLLLQLD